MISHERKCIFIHIPRTGGSSIEDVIWPGERTEAHLWMGFVDAYHNKYQTGGLQHLFATQVRKVVGDRYFNAYFKFAFVRNPWDKAVSQYMLTRGRPDLQQFIGMREGDSFKSYLELTARRRHVQWTPQYQFVYDDNGNLLVDYIGRFEQLQEDARLVFSRIGLDCALPHSHGSERLPIEAYYDREAIEMVTALFQRDIELFGYADCAPALSP